MCSKPLLVINNFVTSQSDNFSNNYLQKAAIYIDSGYDIETVWRVRIKIPQPSSLSNIIAQVYEPMLRDFVQKYGVLNNPDLNPIQFLFELCQEHKCHRGK